MQLDAVLIDLRIFFIGRQLTLSGLILWIILYMASNSIALTILQDLWDRNLMLLTLVLYKVSLFSSMALLLPHIALLIVTSWWIAFIIIGSILRFGTRIQTLAWALVAVISPFSAIYYPLSSLPQFAQNIAHLIPSSYIFESAREVITTGNYDMAKLVTCLLLNVVYLALSLVYLKTSIDTARKRGLASLY